MLVILGFPHLVLAHVGDNDGLLFVRLVPEIVDDVRGIKMAAVRKVLDVADCRVSLQAPDILDPLAAVLHLDMRHEFPQNFAQVADQGHIHFDVLIDFRLIDVHVDFLCIGRVGLQASCHAIVEAHAEGQQQVGFLDCVIHPGLSVHAHHAEIQEVRSRHRSKSQQRERHRNGSSLCKFEQFVHGFGEQNAVSRQGSRDASIR